MGIALLVILVIAALVVFNGYNALVSKKEAVITDEKGIAIQLDERNKLFDSLIATVKEYMNHEKGTFAEIVKLRNQVKAGGSDMHNPEVHKAEEKLSEIVASGGISLTMEDYPELKSSQNMLQLQESIETIERKLANSKKAFNMSIEDYNAYAQGLPGLWIIKMFPNLKHKFERWELSKEKIEAAEERVVSFK